MKIIFISSQLPSPLETGGTNLRTRLLLDGLRELGDVEFHHLELHGSNSSGEDEVIQRFRAVDELSDLAVVARYNHVDGKNRLGRLWQKLVSACGFLGQGTESHRLRFGFRKNSRLYNTILSTVQRERSSLLVFRYIDTALIAGLLDRGFPKSAVIIDADDWPSSFFASRISRKAHKTLSVGAIKDLYMRLKARAAQRMEAILIERASSIFVASSADAREMATPVVRWLPNLPMNGNASEIEACEPSPKDSRTLLIVATYVYPPNREGLEWFFQTCWGRLLEAVPDIRLKIVGKVPEPFQSKWKQQRQVELLGFVPDLEELYEESALVLAPIQWGGGTKLKVLEAFAYGRCVVGTEHALGEIAREEGENFGIFTNDIDELIDGCVKLLLDINVRHRKEVKVRGYARSTFSRKRFNEIVQQAVTEACPGIPLSVVRQS